MEQLALRLQDSRAVLVLTHKGWQVSAKLSGTRYWPDADSTGAHPDSNTVIMAFMGAFEIGFSGPLLAGIWHF
jgi:hypothetical protein